MKSSTRIVILLTCFLIVSDLTFVAINYFGAKKSLELNAVRLGESAMLTFERTLESSINQMQMLATYISNDPQIIQAFKEGRDAVLAEGGGRGKALANIKRQNLRRLVDPSWEIMTNRFKVRQLHFHLGPGSLSFLRVHRPDKFGDRMDEVRYTVVDVNQYGKTVGGFETGRVYSGIRGVVPVYDSSENQNNPELIGALEAGTSFSLLLDLLKEELNSEMAVFLTKSHIEKNVWPEFQKTHYKDGPVFSGHYLEGCTCPDDENLLKSITIDYLTDSHHTTLVKVDHHQFAITTIPLRDYRGTVNKNLSPVGTVAVYQPMDNEFAAFYNSLKANILFAVIGLFIAEILLILAVRFISGSLQKTIDRQTIDLQNALTQLEDAREKEIEVEKLKTANKFAATIAHEFNNPLAIIKGNCDLYLNADDKRKKYTPKVEAILKQVDRMKKLVQNLLNLDKLEEQHYADTITIYDLNESSSGSKPTEKEVE